MVSPTTLGIQLFLYEYHNEDLHLSEAEDQSLLTQVTQTKKKDGSGWVGDGVEITAFLPVGSFLILTFRFLLLIKLSWYGYLKTAKGFVKASGDKSQMGCNNENKSKTRVCWDANIYGQSDKVHTTCSWNLRETPSVFRPFRRILHNRFTLRRMSNTVRQYQLNFWSGQWIVFSVGRHTQTELSSSCISLLGLPEWDLVHLRPIGHIHSFWPTIQFDHYLFQ